MELKEFVWKLNFRDNFVTISILSSSDGQHYHKISLVQLYIGIGIYILTMVFNI